MFLDEELYQIGSKFDGSNDIELIKDMIGVCLERTSADLISEQNDAILIPVFKRVNYSWNLAIDRLAKENKKITVKDGFLLFLLNSNKFECVHSIVNEVFKSLSNDSKSIYKKK
jgi:hypothetical protein